MTAEYVRECLDYDPETGAFTWKIRPRHHFPTENGWRRVNAGYAGKPAGCFDSKGYLRVRIANELHHGHRLAWLLTHGDWPREDIDHANGNKHDNRITNIRQAKCAENLRNSRLRKDSSSGVKNVYMDKRDGVWRVYLTIGGRQRHLGGHASKADAEAAAKEARIQHYGEFANHGEHQERLEKPCV